MDLERWAQAWRRRATAERAALETQAEEARLAARKASKVLVQEFGASQVWLFGSLAWGSVHARFDVDLAVMDLKPNNHSSALARVWEIVGRPVDLVSLETCPSPLRRRIPSHENPFERKRMAPDRPAPRAS